MNGKQYNNIIEYTLKYVETENSLDAARTVFKNMGVALPNGTIQDVYATIKSNNYMGWRKCTIQEAQQRADKGVATIGINDNRIIIVSAIDKEQSISEPICVMSFSENSSECDVNDLQYYSYSYETTKKGPIIYCSNNYLSRSQMTSNAQYILNYLRVRGWTKNAICGMLGNMQTESTINPGIWEGLRENNMNKGFGLVQWTPATKFINWANDNELDYLAIQSQLKRILYEVENKIQWYSTTNYPMSFSNFTKSTEPPSYLAATFVYNYERPANYSTLSDRQEQANYWYENLI